MNYGDKNLFSIEIGEVSEGGLQEVNIWAGGHLVTYIDNMAYLPSFIGSLQCEMEEIESGKWDTDKWGRFLDHGPTTDQVSTTIKFSGRNVQLTFSLDNGCSSIVTIEKDHLCGIYKQAVSHLNKIGT